MHTDRSVHANMHKHTNTHTRDLDKNWLTLCPIFSYLILFTYLAKSPQHVVNTQKRHAGENGGSWVHCVLHAQPCLTPSPCPAWMLLD